MILERCLPENNGNMPTIPRTVMERASQSRSSLVPVTCSIRASFPQATRRCDFVDLPNDHNGRIRRNSSLAIICRECHKADGVAVVGPFSNVGLDLGSCAPAVGVILIRSGRFALTLKLKYRFMQIVVDLGVAKESKL